MSKRMSSSLCARPGHRRRCRSAGLSTLAALLLAVASPHAGTMSVAWDPVPAPDLGGYRVFVGSAPETGDIAVLDVGAITSVDLVGLPDCVTLFVAVKAVDLSGNESVAFSNSISGMTQPEVTSIDPSVLQQGAEMVTLHLTGASFSSLMSRSDVIFDETEIRVLDLNWLGCNDVEVQVAVGPFVASPGDPGYNGDGTTVEIVDPAQQGVHAVQAVAPDGGGDRIAGSASCGAANLATCGSSTVLQVDWLDRRSDADLSGRVDGFDLARIARANGSTRCTAADASANLCDPTVQPFYDAGVDLNGDKQVDGTDLSFLSSLFGEVF
ncbi:MAG: hypothetical protein ACE5IK_02080 [Acidobacteriota bacterium]